MAFRNAYRAFQSSVRPSVRNEAIHKLTDSLYPGRPLDVEGCLRRENFGDARRFASRVEVHGTTVLCVRREGTVVIAADGQVTMGSQIVKPNVRKLRRLGEGKNVIAGFAGSTADAFSLFDRLEQRIDEYPGQLTRAAVELAKAWRTDKFLRKLDAMLVVADSRVSLTITGNGDVLEPHDGVIGIGSGGPYALAAARALIEIPDLSAEEIARRAMKIAADCCVYTNENVLFEKVTDADSGEGAAVKAQS